MTRSMNDRLQWTTRLGLIAGALSLALLAVSPSAWAVHLHNASQVEVTEANCTPPSEIPVPTNLHVLGNPTVASFTVHFDDIPITGQCAPKTYTATVRDLTNNVANVGHSACTLKTFTCTTTGLEKATEYSITITASDRGKTSQPSLPLTVVTPFGSISAPTSTGQPSWNASTASWQVPFSQPNDAGATTTVTVIVSSCDPSLSQAGVSAPTELSVTVAASRGRAPIPAVQNNLTGIPVSFTLSAVATVDVGGRQETSTSSVTAVHGCWLTPLPPACYGPAAAKGSFHPTFTPTPPGLATSMTLTLTPSDCGSLGLFQPTFSYWVGQHDGIPFPCAQTTWQQSPTHTCSLIRSQYPNGVDPTQDQIWVQASYVDPGAYPLPSGTPSFSVPPSRIDGGKQAFTWPASSVPVAAQATGSSTDGSNGWSTMTVTVGALGNLFWNPSSMQAPQGLSMTPTITCGQASITDLTVQNVSQSSGVLQYSVSEVSKASTYAVDDDLSTCSVSVSFSSTDRSLPSSTFSPTASVSSNLFESGITTPQNSWFGSCKLSDGTTVIISSNTSPACGSTSVTAGGVNGGPAPGAFLSTQTSGCQRNTTAGVVVECSPTVDPSTIQFRWRFGGHDYSVSTDAIVELANSINFRIRIVALAFFLLSVTALLLLLASKRRRRRIVPNATSTTQPLHPPMNSFHEPTPRGPVAQVLSLAPMTLMKAGRTIRWFGFGDDEVQVNGKPNAPVIPVLTEEGMVWSAHPRKAVEITGGWSEKTPGKGEDAPPIAIVSSTADRGALCTFDGTGGAGAVVVNREDRAVTQAFEAARLGRAAFHQWITPWVQGNDRFPEGEDLRAALAASFAEHSGSLDAVQSNLTSSFARVLPTTMAAILFSAFRNHVNLRVLWAGDSRCYALTPTSGLQQLSVDDTRIPDAFDSLTEDPPLENLVCADRPVTVNQVDLQVRKPAIVISASDGCFGYWPTPPMFEAEVLRALMGASTASEWADRLLKVINEVARDDVSFSIVAVGFESFAAVQSAFAARAEHMRGSYYQPFVDLTTSKASRDEYDRFRREAWERYRPTYEAELHELHGEQQ